MKVTEARVLDLIKKTPQFFIPNQGAYTWTERECELLWDAIIRTGKNNKTPVHFMGSIVYVKQASSPFSSLVIDGQQKLITITLLIEALARVIGHDEPVIGFSDIKLRNDYLLNRLEPGLQRYKLLLSQMDGDTVMAIIEQQQISQDHSPRLVQNFRLFLKLLGKERDLTTVCKGLSKLIVADISLDYEQDNLPLIFESLNLTGK